MPVVVRQAFVSALLCAVMAMSCGCARRTTPDRAQGSNATSQSSGTHVAGPQPSEAERQTVQQALDRGGTFRPDDYHIKDLAFQSITKDAFERRARFHCQYREARDSIGKAYWSFTAAAVNKSDESFVAADISGFLAPEEIIYGEYYPHGAPVPSEPARIAVVVYQFSDKQLSAKKKVEYCKSLVSLHYPLTAFDADASEYFWAKGSPDPHQFWPRFWEDKYKLDVQQLGVSDRGSPFDVFAGPGPDGRYVGILFFDAGPDG